MFFFLIVTDIRHPEELSLLKKPRDPTKKKKKKLDDQSEDEALELEGPLITPGSGESLTKHGFSVRTMRAVCMRACVRVCVCVFEI